MTIVRHATPGDAHALVELAESVGREDGRWILGTGPWRSVSDERRYLRTIHRHPDAAVYVAEDGTRIVGRLSLSRDPHPASRHVADLGLMVAESHRRQGVGTMLLEQAVAWAREAQVRKLELHVFPWNEPALGLYESFGFEREGYRKRQYERGGELVDAVLMAYFVVDDEVPAARARRAPRARGRPFARAPTAGTGRAPGGRCRRAAASSGSGLAGS